MYKHIITYIHIYFISITVVVVSEISCLKVKGAKFFKGSELLPAPKCLSEELKNDVAWPVFDECTIRQYLVSIYKF